MRTRTRFWGRSVVKGWQAIVALKDHVEVAVILLVGALVILGVSFRLGGHWFPIGLALLILIGVVLEGAYLEYSGLAGSGSEEVVARPVGRRVDQLGYLEIMRDGKKAFVELPKEIAEVGERLTKMTQEITSYGPMPDDVNARIRIAHKAAKSLKGFTAFLERRVASLRVKTAYSVRLWSETVKRQDVGTDVGREVLGIYKASFAAMTSQTAPVPSQFHAMKSAIENLGADPPTERLRTECARSVAALDGWIVVMDEIRAGTEAAVSIIDQRLKG